MKWIKSKIEEYLRTDRPVTAILEVTTVTDKPPNADNQIRNAIRREICLYIAANLCQPTPVADGLEIKLEFEQDKDGLVHYITRSGYIDNLKSAYMKKRLGKIQAELRQKYPPWNVRLNFLLTKPLAYISPDMARLITDQARPSSNVVEEDVDMGDWAL